MTLGINERVQILLDGIRFNADESSDPDDCYWPARLRGWNSRRARTQRSAKPTLPGSFRTPNPQQEKIIVIEGACLAPSPEARSRAENRLAALCSNPSQLYRMEVTEEFATTYRDVELEHADPERYNELVFMFALQVASPDPAKYGTTLLEASTTLPSSAGIGLDWTAPGLNWTGGLDWGTPTSTGVIALLNEGTSPTWPIFTIAAGAQPLVNPAITSQATGRTLYYNGTLQPGDTLVIVTNPFGRSVLLDGSGDRRPLLTRAEWFPVPKQSTAAVTFSASVYSPTATLTASWSPAYL